MRQHKYYKLIKVDYEDTGYFYIKNVSNEVGEFKIANYTSGTLEYSTDGVNWTSYNLNTKPSVNVNPDSHIYLRGAGFKSNSSNGCIDFTKSYIIGGNFMSVSNYSTMTSVTAIGSTNVIQNAFRNQTNLISAEKMNFGNVASVGQNGCYGMFDGCTSLTTPPDLSSVTSIGQYGCMYMLSGCTSLTTPPDLSSVTSIGISGCSVMLRVCSLLATAIAPNVQDLTQNNVLSNWLQNAGTEATGTKTVNVPTGATIETGSDSGIPTGWTRVDY